MGVKGEGEPVLYPARSRYRNPPSAHLQTPSAILFPTGDPDPCLDRDYVQASCIL
jgi:hypothetical protein